MTKIVLGVPTFRRPEGLERLLTAVARLETDAEVLVVVADNDAERQEGLNVCRRLVTGGYRWPLRAIVVPELGISFARNALVQEALAESDADFVAMLDDDEWPEPQWLEELLDVQAETRADVVGGPVVRQFESAPPRWARECDFFLAKDHPRGTIEFMGAAGNVLVTCAVLRKLPPPWFDPAFGLTGGEDKEMFTRLKRQGRRFAWAPAAVVWETVPGSRVTLRWVLNRAYLIGNSDIRIAMKYHPSAAGRIREGTKVVAAVLASPVLVLLAVCSPRHRAFALRKLWRASGKTAGLAHCGSSDTSRPWR